LVQLNVGLEVLIITIFPITTSFISTNGVNVITILYFVYVLVQLNVGLEISIITISPIIITPFTSFIGTNGVNVIAVINFVYVLVQLNVSLEISIPKISIGIWISSAINIVDSIIDLYKVIHVISSLITWSIIVS
jgi:hypothetical protein